MKRIILFLSLFLCSQMLKGDEAWKRIYFTSFPESGGQWIRCLIEEATLIATSSVYKADSSHEKFPWGGYSPQKGLTGVCLQPDIWETILINTHYPFVPSTEFDSKVHQKVIRIVRHPLYAFYETYKKKVGEKRAKQFIPENTLTKYVEGWRNFQRHWDRQSNVITIRYEDFYVQPHHYLKLILDEMGCLYIEDDIDRALKRFPPRGGMRIYINHYTKEERNRIKAQIPNLLKKYKYDHF